MSSHTQGCSVKLQVVDTRAGTGIWLTARLTTDGRRAYSLNGKQKTAKEVKVLVVPVHL